jgi:hypothetical protein
MKNRLATLAAAAGLALTLLTTACTQMPTEKQGVSDMRPQISFKPGNEQVKAAGVLVDGLAMGVVLGSQVLLEQKFYIGDGVNRTFTLQ